MFKSFGGHAFISLGINIRSGLAGSFGAWELTVLDGGGGEVGTDRSHVMKEAGGAFWALVRAKTSVRTSLGHANMEPGKC